MDFPSTIATNDDDTKQSSENQPGVLRENSIEINQDIQNHQKSPEVIELDHGNPRPQSSSQSTDTVTKEQSTNNLTKNAGTAHAAKMLDNKDGFSNVFLCDWQLAVRRVDTGRRLMETLQSFMRERAQLEEMYATGLEKLAKKLVAPSSESSGVVATVASVQSDSIRRAQQARELADCIKMDIIESTLSTTISNHHQVLKQINSDGINISRSLSNAVNEVRKVECEVARLGREAFQSAREAQMMSKSMSSQQTRVASKALGQIQELQAAENRYRFSVKIANDTKRVYSTQMKVILRSLEDMDFKRLACFKDALRKLMVYQTSMLRNGQYDLDLTIQAVEELSEISEIEQFLHRGREALGLTIPQQGDVPTSTSQSPFQPLSVSLPPNFEYKHWALLCLSPPSTVENSFPYPPVSSVSNVRRDSTSGITVESATAAARNLLKKTPLDNFVQSAAAHLASIGISTTIPDVSNTNGPNTDVPNTTNTSSSSQSPPAESTSSTVVTPAPEVLLWLSGESGDLDEINSRGGATAHDIAISKIRKDYNALLDLIFNYNLDCSKSLWTGIEKLREELSSSLHRGIMVHCLDLKREAEQYQLPNMDALRILGCIVETLLAWCEKQWDIVNGRTMMILVQKFYAKGKPSDDPQGSSSVWIWPHLREIQKNNDESSSQTGSQSDRLSEGIREQPEENVVIRWFLHRVVYHHVLWNRVHFWEEALLFSISQNEQQKLLRSSEETVTAALETPLNTSSKLIATSSLYDGLLDKFGACMIAFGIADSQVVALIQKVCREQNLTSEFTLDLLRCVAHRQDQTPSTEIILPLAPFEALAHPVASPSTASKSRFERFGNPPSTMMESSTIFNAVENSATPNDDSTLGAVSNAVLYDLQRNHNGFSNGIGSSELGRHEIFDD